MKNLCRMLALIAVVVLLGAENLFARTVFVAERQEITQRSGPSTDHRVMKMLPTSMRLTVLDEGDGWLRVQAPDGSMGWVLQRFTSPELPSSIQLERLQQEHDQLREDSAGALDMVAELKSTNQNLMNTLSETTNNLLELESKYSALAAEAANVIELREKFDQTVHDLGVAQTRIEALSSENEELRASERLRWFLTGAGVVFGAWFFGFLTGRQQRRRKTGLQL